MSNAEKILYGTECRIVVEKTGNSLWDTVRFVAESNDPITIEIAKHLQRIQGYHPLGYGFYTFSCEQSISNGKYYAKWECSACCD